MGQTPGFNGGDSSARGINDLGQVVGDAWVSPQVGDDAFLYSNGIMTDLDSYLPPGSPWQLVAACGINDEGQIVGQGLLNGTAHALLLDLAEPATVSLLCAGVGLLAFYRITRSLCTERSRRAV